MTRQAPLPVPEVVSSHHCRPSTSLWTLRPLGCQRSQQPADRPSPVAGRQKVDDIRQRQQRASTTGQTYVSDRLPIGPPKHTILGADLADSSRPFGSRTAVIPGRVARPTDCQRTGRPTLPASQRRPPVHPQQDRPSRGPMTSRHGAWCRSEDNSRVSCKCADKGPRIGHKDAC